MPDLHVDIINAGGPSGGGFARMLTANGKFDYNVKRPYIDDDGKAKMVQYLGGDPAADSSYRVRLINNATLRRDEWKALDEAVLEERNIRLGGIQDLISRGLTYNLGNAMGTTVLEWHRRKNSQSARMDMNGVSRGQNDRPDFDFNYIPIPIIHADYEISLRDLSASRNMGNPLDTTNASDAAREIDEYLESLLFTNTTFPYASGTIYSYVNYPHRNQVSLSTNWDEMVDDSDGTVGKKIIDDVLSLINANKAKRFHGPFKLYIPSNYDVTLEKDYDSTTPGTTIRERILKISQISEISVNDTLPEDNVLLVQMTSDVVRLINGMAPTNLEWDSEGGMVLYYKVMAIQVPQIRSDAMNRCGIAHLA